ncbi:MAG: hypothetical protein P1P88_17805 [Bacteroidales bacterium]|nr:hypothetical protein [Bacteroidales bacterium]
MKKDLYKKPNAILLIFIALSICMSVNYGWSQQKDSTFYSKNTTYVDFASKGAFYSINYDKIFHQKKKFTLSYRIGFSILEDGIAMPLGVNLFTGKGNSHVEYSLTVIPYIDHYKSFLSSNDLSDKYLYVVPGIGYRFQKPTGGIFFKIVVSPMIFLDPPSSNFWKMDPKLYFAGNVGIGFSF